MDFSAIPKPAKKQKQHKKTTIVTVTEVSEEKHTSRDLFRSDAGKEFLKWFKRHRRSQSPSQINDRSFFEQARAYDCIEPLVPLLVTEKRPRADDVAYFGCPQ
ncbi:hypothetical protein Slin15195_G088120 [Septoria linicola]|uniref:Uncharacterized protein n=1 Tax=Septoria linicola TaxID=215465 RepID=A0A9Q9AYE4_9PEZI|nr:hypothetical protein Slin14017_G090730 [Septoria linicola]USW55493.1 hypothetical protein Slin15195_G088120 [Septoria linicola]